MRKLVKNWKRSLDPSYWEIQHTALIKIAVNTVFQPILKSLLTFGHKAASYQISYQIEANWIQTQNFSNGGKFEIFPLIFTKIFTW